MSSYADHQRMTTLEQRVATLEVRAAETERVMVQLSYAMEELKKHPIPLGGQHVALGLDNNGLATAQMQAQQAAEQPSPYEQWREKKAARKAAE